MYKISKHDAAKRCIEDDHGLCFSSCRDLDFLNDTLSFLKAILLEIIRCTRYFFSAHKRLKKKMYYFQKLNMSYRVKYYEISSRSPMLHNN